MEKDLTREEEYIVAESKELNLGDRVTRLDKVLGAFPAFKYRNYKLYFFGQFISLVGLWLQIVAEGWLAFQLSHSPFWVGVVAAAGTLPSLVLSLIGGVIVDRFSRRRVLLVTQNLEMLLVFALGLLVLFNLVNLWNLILLSFLLGIVDAVDSPARQAFVVELVDRKDLSSAIALNSGMFNLARVIGPSIAGILIGFLGMSAAFIINGFTFIPAVIAIYFIREQTKLAEEHPHPIEAIKEGIRYAVGHPTIRTLLLFSIVVTIFGWSYGTLLPVMVENIFHKTALELGYLYASVGVGALLAAIFISAFSKRFKETNLVIAGCFIVCVGLFLFTFTSNLFIAFLFLFLTGFGLTTQFSMINLIIQHAVSDAIRGRVMSIYVVTFLGMMPIGSFLIGVVADKLNSEYAIRIGVTIVFAFLCYIFFNRKRLFASVQG